MDDSVSFLETVSVKIGRSCYSRHAAGTRMKSVTPDYDILCTTSGRYGFTVGRERVDLPAGKLIVLPPGTRYAFDTQEDSEHIFCHFSLATEQNAPLLLHFDRFTLTADLAALADGFRCVYGRYYGDKARGTQPLSLMCKLLLWELLLDQDWGARMVCLSERAALPPDIVAVMNHIYENESVAMNGADLSRVAGMNYCYFLRKFKRTTGISLPKYVNMVKIEIARRRLTTTGVSVKELAYSLGYADPFTFSKKFKEQCGVCPSEYRGINEKEIALR